MNPIVLAYHYLADPFHHSFMQRAAEGVILVGVTCAILGCFVVLRRMAFIGDAIAHTALPGVVVAYLNNLNLFAGALVAGLLTALGIGWLSSREELREDTAIGVLFTGMFALGILIISRHQTFRDFEAMLFGYILGVGHRDLILMSTIAIIVILMIALFFKELELTSVDPSYSQVIGLRVNWMRNLLLMLLALAVVTGIQVAGVILVSGLLITPAASASLMTRNLKTMMIVASLLSVLGGMIGLYASFYGNAGAGSAIVLTGTAFFIFVFCVRYLINFLHRRAPSAEPAA